MARPEPSTGPPAAGGCSAVVTLTRPAGPLPQRPDHTVVGFAAEHGAGAVERGRAKLARKGLDAVVVNDISRSDIGFDSSENEVTIVSSDGDREVGRRPKEEVAAAILDEVERFRTRAAPPTTVEPES